MSKYSVDRVRMDQIAERLSERQDIWQDRYIYWIAVTLGHILEWIVKNGSNAVSIDSRSADINETIDDDSEQDGWITWE